MAEPRSLAPGVAAGPALVLDAPLSLWGGIDPVSGRIVDVHHPQHGSVVTGTVLVMPSGRGSSSSSTVLSEAIRLGTAPVAIVLRERDEIVALGAIVARELYGIEVPVVVTDIAIGTGSSATVSATGDGASVVIG